MNTRALSLHIVWSIQRLEPVSASDTAIGRGELAVFWRTQNRGVSASRTRRVQE